MAKNNKQNLKLPRLDELKLNEIFKEKATHKGAPPGIITYTGSFTEEPFHGQIYIFDQTCYEKIDFTTAQEVIKVVPKDDKSFEQIVWINVIGLNSPVDLKKMGAYFEIPDLFMEDIVHISKHNKYNITQELFFCVMQMIYFGKELIKYESISILFKNNIIFTFQEKEGDVFGNIRNCIETGTGNVRAMQGEYLCFSLLDTLIDNYIEILRSLNSQIDLAEENIITNELIDLKGIYTLKKQLLFLKTTIIPLSTLVYDIRMKNEELFSESIFPYLGDLNEHIIHMNNEVNLQNEVLSNLFETYMIYSSNDTNKVMTTLTIFSAIFIPLSFMAGVFGMNFRSLPGIEQPMSFNLFVAACVTVAALMITYFKKMKWF